MVHSNNTTYMVSTHFTFTHACVSHTSDVNITFCLHSIALKKAIVYVYTGEQEKRLLPHSIIPTNTLHIFDLFIHIYEAILILIHTLDEMSILYHSPKVVRPKSTCWEMIT